MAASYQEMVGQIGRGQALERAGGNALGRVGDLAVNLGWDEGATRLLSHVLPGGPPKDGAAKRWVLQNTDRDSSIVGQFHPENLTYRVSQTVAEEVPQNSDVAVQNYVHGNVDEIGFTATFHATHGNDFTVRQQLYALQNLVKKDPALHRPPICLFSAGLDISMICLVHDVAASDIELRDDGTLRSLRVSVTLKKYDPIDVDLTDRAKLKEPARRVVPEGMDWEMLGWIEYGLTNLGRVLEDFNHLWATNGDGRPLVSGDEVEIMSEEDARRAAGSGDFFSLALDGTGSAAAFGVELAGKMGK